MPATQKPFAGVATVRLATQVVTPPGILGWNHLIEPDEYTAPDGKVVKKRKANIHFNDDQLAALVRRLQLSAIEPLWERLLKEMKDKGYPERVYKEGRSTLTAPWAMPDAQDWEDASLNEPAKEGELPYIVFSRAAEYVDRKTNEVKQMRVRVTGSKGEPLDLATLRLGRGSTVQGILTPSLYVAGASAGVPALSLKLDGLRIIKLEQYGGGGPALGEISEEDMALLGGDVEVDDMSQYVAAAKGEHVKEAHKAALREGPHGEQYHDEPDLDEEIPF